jgi:hypothetical protein
MIQLQMNNCYTIFNLVNSLYKSSALNDNKTSLLFLSTSKIRTIL